MSPLPDIDYSDDDCVASRAFSLLTFARVVMDTAIKSPDCPPAIRKMLEEERDEIRSFEGARQAALEKRIDALGGSPI